MPLDTRSARKLTSREISKIIGSILGGLCDWCEVKEIMDAIDHFYLHRDQY